MSIQWADDFSRYGTGSASRTAMLEGLPYANIVGLSNNGAVNVDPDPNAIGSRAFKVASTAVMFVPQAFRTAIPVPIGAQTLGICWRGWLNELPEDSLERPHLFGMQNNSGSYIVYIRAELNGAISVIARVGGVQTEIVTGVSPLISPASWNHFEMIHDNATGEGELRINGVVRVSWTGVDTGQTITLINASANSGLPSGDPGYYIKDLVVWDGNGSVNNSAQGTVIVRRLNPDGDNTLGGWTPSTGTTGFDLLDKAAPNDASYLSADDTPPAPMAFTLDDLPPDITSVRALIPVVRMRKIDGGDATVQNSLSPDGTNWDPGADRPITTAFSYYFDVSELDPATSTPWAPSAVDTALLRIDRTT